jgi:hypothetical protein
MNTSINPSFIIEDSGIKKVGTDLYFTNPINKNETTAYYLNRKTFSSSSYAGVKSVRDSLVYGGSTNTDSYTFAVLSYENCTIYSHSYQVKDCCFSYCKFIYDYRIVDDIRYSGSTYNRGANARMFKTRIYTTPIGLKYMADNSVFEDCVAYINGEWSYDSVQGLTIISNYNYDDDIKTPEVPNYTLESSYIYGSDLYSIKDTYAGVDKIDLFVVSPAYRVAQTNSNHDILDFGGTNHNWMR